MIWKPDCIMRSVTHTKKITMKNNSNKQVPKIAENNSYTYISWKRNILDSYKQERVHKKEKKKLSNKCSI